MSERPSRVGILAIDVYFPSTYVDQEELEEFDGVGKGHYTVGLGQQKMSFVDDREDINSICLTVVHRLFEKYKIDPKDVGRVEVGTETLLDDSSSVIKELMRFFIDHGNPFIEGTGCINGSYGGTAALFNSVAWIESHSWDGRLALCVAADIAVYAEGPARPTGGVGAVAMVVGPNAPILFAPGARVSHMEHAYDFYKPDLRSDYPAVDGKLSNACYERALDDTYARLVSLAPPRVQRPFNFESVEFCCFHGAFTKLVRKAVGRLLLNEFVRNPDNPMFAAESIQQYRGVDIHDTYEKNRKVLKAFVALSGDVYSKKVEESTLLTAETGNTYCASLYQALASLIHRQGAALSGKFSLLFSYGSGLCSSMFVIHYDKNSMEKMEAMKNILKLEGRLGERVKVSPSEYSNIMHLREKHFAAKGFEPTSSTDRLASGTYYLLKVDEKFRRTYSRKE